MALTLGGTTLPEPYVYEVSEPSIGAYHDLASGNIGMDLVAQKRRWKIAWRMLTTADRDVILTKYRTMATMTFIDYDAGTYTVIFGQEPRYPKVLLGNVTYRCNLENELLETG